MGLLSDKQLGAGKSLKDGDLGVNVPQITGPTGSVKLPNGTTAQRDAAPVNGLIRHNSQIGQIEVFVNGAWEGLDGGAAAESAAVNANISANAAAADLVLTNADVVLTNADVVTTNTNASNAQTAETNALAAQAAAELALDNFTDIYLGSFAANPTLDNDGNPLITGALFWYTTLSILRVYNGSSWEDVGAATSANNVSYNNAGSTLAAVTAQNAIDELDAEKTNTGHTHLIADITDIDAVDVPYSNTTSGLTATNTQAAIDEVEGRVDTINSTLTTKANLASPALSGTPTGPTAAADTNTTQLATTAYVQTELVDRAPLASPALSGTPTAPTQAAANNTTRIATTAFVQGEIASKANLASPALTGNPTSVTPATADNDTSIATTAYVKNNLADYVATNVSTTITEATKVKMEVPAGTDLLTATGSINSLEIFQPTISTDALMTFHVGSDFACHFGLDGGTNKLSVGGYSMGAVSYEIYHAGNVQPSAVEWGGSAKTTSTSAASGGADGDFWFQY